MQRLSGVFLLLSLTASAIFWAVGWLFRRRLSAKELYVWLPRLQLAFALIVGTLFVTYSILIGVWIFGLAVAAFTGLCVYYVVALARVCETCGYRARLESSGAPPQHCPKCGAPLRRSALFRQS
jgi:predicted RNA-binding Zn-ribbon protein involved in translation (DUF1610 family)